MIATPTSRKPFKDAYNGCILFRFAELETARLVERDGQPAPVKTLNGDAGSFNGACEVSAGPPRIWLSQLVMQGKMPLFTIRQRRLQGMPH